MSDFAATRLSPSAAAAAAERTLAFLRSVYLNFINLFLILLRLTGERRA